MYKTDLDYKRGMEIRDTFYSQPAVQQKKLAPLNKDQVLQVKHEMKKNKKILPDFQDEIYHTLSFFPELKNTHIRFKYQKLSTTLNARPTIYSLLFKRKENRRYVVRINNSQKSTSVQLSEVPYNARIGVLAHEFSHFIDYSEKGIWGITKRLISYTRKNSKAKFEQEIDTLTIERGLGWQLHDWAYTVLHDSNIGTKYRKLKEEVYLTPSKIRSCLMEIDMEMNAQYIPIKIKTDNTGIR